MKMILETLNYRNCREPKEISLEGVEFGGGKKEKAGSLARPTLPETNWCSRSQRQRQT